DDARRELADPARVSRRERAEERLERRALGHARAGDEERLDRRDAPVALEAREGAERKPAHASEPSLAARSATASRRAIRSASSSGRTGMPSARMPAPWSATRKGVVTRLSASALASLSGILAWRAMASDATAWSVPGTRTKSGSYPMALAARRKYSA